MHTQAAHSSDKHGGIKMRVGWPFGAFSLALIALLAGTLAGRALPAPGAEEAGLRLRLAISPKQGASNETYSVRADLINATNRPVTVAAMWPSDGETGDFKDYFEAALSIKTAPAIISWGIQVMADSRQTPQPTAVLEPGKMLTVQWVTSGRRLKNKLTRPLEVRNPYFPSTGKYRVYVELKLRVTGTDQAVVLRSNPQSVDIGGDTGSPKFPLATVKSVSEKAGTAMIDLGSLHGIQTNDEFLVRTGMSDWWLLTVAETGDKWSKVAVQPCYRFAATRTNAPLPKPGMNAGLVPRNAKGADWMWPTEKKDRKPAHERTARTE